MDYYVARISIKHHEPKFQDKKNWWCGRIGFIQVPIALAGDFSKRDGTAKMVEQLQNFEDEVTEMNIYA